MLPQDVDLADLLRTDKFNNPSIIDYTSQPLSLDEFLHANFYYNDYFGKFNYGGLLRRLSKNTDSLWLLNINHDRVFGYMRNISTDELLAVLIYRISVDESIYSSPNKKPVRLEKMVYFKDKIDAWLVTYKENNWQDKKSVRRIQVVRRDSFKTNFEETHRKLLRDYKKIIQKGGD